MSSETNSRGRLIAKVLISGDDHLKSSKKHGQHNDYGAESLYYFKMLGDYCIENEITHWIGLGDLTYGRFTSLEYRDKVEEELSRQNKILNGNRWIIKGNHDRSSSGMTEYDYYLKKGYFKGSELLQIGPLNINMIDNKDKIKDYSTAPVLVEENKQNILLTHGYFTFKGQKLDFGESVLLDDMHNWYNCSLILCGHIHTKTVLEGFINDGKGNACKTTVCYLPCLSRPSYLEGRNPEFGQVVVIEVYENYIDAQMKDIELLPLEKSFNIEGIMAANKKEELTSKLDLKDIVSQLDDYNFNVALNPEDVIMGMSEVPEKVRKRACEYIKQSYS